MLRGRASSLPFEGQSGLFEGLFQIIINAGRMDSDGSLLSQRIRRAKNTRESQQNTHCLFYRPAALSNLGQHIWTTFLPVLTCVNWCSIPAAVAFFLASLNNANVSNYLLLYFLIFILPGVYVARLVELTQRYPRLQWYNNNFLQLISFFSLTVFLMDAQGSISAFILALHNHLQFDPGMVTDWQFGLILLGVTFFSAVLSLSALGVYKKAREYLPFLEKPLKWIDVIAAWLRYVVKGQAFGITIYGLMELFIPLWTRYTDPVPWALLMFALGVFAAGLGIIFTDQEIRLERAAFGNNVRLIAAAMGLAPKIVNDLLDIHLASDGPPKALVYAAEGVSLSLLAAPFVLLFLYLMNYLWRLLKNYLFPRHEEDRPLISAVEGDEEDPIISVDISYLGSPASDSLSENTTFPGSSSPPGAGVAPPQALAAAHP